MIKRSVKIAGHATSISLEPEFWEILTRIAEEKSMSINALIADIDKTRTGRNLSSAVRVRILKELQKTATRL